MYCNRVRSVHSLGVEALPRPSGVGSAKAPSCTLTTATYSSLPPPSFLLCRQEEGRAPRHAVRFPRSFQLPWLLGILRTLAERPKKMISAEKEKEEKIRNFKKIYKTKSFGACQTSEVSRLRRTTDSERALQRLRPFVLTNTAAEATNLSNLKN